MKDENIEKLRKLGEALERIYNFTNAGSRRYDSAWFAKEFLLKNILGLTDEEYEQNEKLLIDAAAKNLARAKKIESLSKIKSAEEDFEDMPMMEACDMAKASL